MAGRFRQTLAGQRWACPEERTAAGRELQFAINHLGHFTLATGLHKALAADGTARIVSVSSSGHQLSPVIFDGLHLVTTTAFNAVNYQTQSGFGTKRPCHLLNQVLSR